MYTVIIAGSIGLSSWALYHTACFLVEGIGHFGEQKQLQFNATLSQYLWVFSVIGIVAGSMMSFYFTKRQIQPIRSLIQSTKELKQGEYPEPIEIESEDEVGELVEQYNGLIQQLQGKEAQRQKLVTDLSHEFRTPLANLQGYLQALENGVIEGDRDLYRSLYEESHRLTQLVEQLDQLKEWDQVQAQTLFKREEVAIAEPIKQSVAMFEWALKQADIPIEVSVEERNMFIHVEGIQQVLNNLLDNAIQYYEGNEAIVVTGKVVDEYYCVSIAGESQHISATAQKHVFERFYRVDPSRNRGTGGTGLGLAIAKEIIQQQHGEIGLQTTDRINCFWFTIPFS